MRKKIVIFLLMLNILILAIPQNLFSKNNKGPVMRMGWWMPGNECHCPMPIPWNCFCKTKF